MGLYHGIGNPNFQLGSLFGDEFCVLGLGQNATQPSATMGATCWGGGSTNSQLPQIGTSC